MFNNFIHSGSSSCCILVHCEVLGMSVHHLNGLIIYTLIFLSSQQQYNVGTESLKMILVFPQSIGVKNKCR